jgi:surface-anchored protein
MKRLVSLILAASTGTQAGLTRLDSHLDVRCHYESGQWNTTLSTDTASHDPGHVFLPLADKPYVNGSASTSGARHTQPTNSAFAFTGAQPGQPIWLAVKGTPGAGEAWPGFDNDQPAGTFGSYIPSDIRVSQTTARPWIRVTLVDYQPPHGKTSHFALWNTTTGQPPTVWMSTFDTNVENSYYYAAGSHTHMWWGFTATGIHRVTLRASAFLRSGATNPTDPGENFTLVFAVGTFARWQAESFDATQLANSATVSPEADPDQDQQANLLEYAFGTHPLSGTATPTASGLGMPVISLTEDNGTLYQTLTYPRRRAGSRLTPEIYQPRFADAPGGPWSDTGVITQATDFPPPHASLNSAWENVTARRPAPPGAVRCFAQAAVIPEDPATPP